MIDIGERVQLKSGGPVMTVTKVGKQYVTCEWPIPNSKEVSHEYALFRPAMLKKVA